MQEHPSGNNNGLEGQTFLRHLIQTPLHIQRNILVSRQVDWTGQIALEQSVSFCMPQAL